MENLGKACLAHLVPSYSAHIHSPSWWAELWGKMLQEYPGVDPSLCNCCAGSQRCPGLPSECFSYEKAKR